MRGIVGDSERRAVARRLRELDDSELQVYDMTYFEIQRAVEGDGDQCLDGRELAHRLADLIEPGGHECVPGECSLNVRHDNDFIDRDALLALADECDSVHMHKVARRIREACGGSE